MRLGQLLAGTTEEEVVTDIQEALQVRIVGMRKSYGETIRATVIMPEMDAEALIRTSRVRVGIIATHPIAPPMRCRSCWGIGNMAAGCKGPDRSSLCFKWNYRFRKPGNPDIKDTVAISNTSNSTTDEIGRQ